MFQIKANGIRVTCYDVLKTDLKKNWKIWGQSGAFCDGGRYSRDQCLGLSCYINNLDQGTKWRISIFVDDSKVDGPVNCEEDIRRFHGDLD